MFIQDLNHLEVVSEEANINGGVGLAIALGSAGGWATGPNAALTNTTTVTFAGVYPSFFFFPGRSVAGSRSTSLSAAS
ncbi:hypothetical protein [Planktothrix agardhii]|jgi:hypothetical protein|uniref:hypothetical protein n=1 Tax=Planktothrix agardhii TaxID=1160 RepID=UPI001D0B63DC|nr:hypothetical protein [Planktothrix agardhii]MCB8784951.1 hypothetical protein [Planktothrix agardhii 1025]MCF3613325.1 hypothetical protein [Planktothrix agardhii 1027]MCF3647208.1 hypothetical protein [Planktothrix agardhii 1026]CAD5934197.1 hypothetical protein NO2A_01942 [Planktothrix agardhii]